MNLTLFAIILAIVLIVFCVYSSIYVSHVIDKTSALLEECLQYQDDEAYKSSAAAAKKAEKTWLHYKTMLCVVLNHQEIDEIQAEFAKLNSHLHEKDSDDQRSTCAGLLSLLQDIRDMQWPYFKNIM